MLGRREVLTNSLSSRIFYHRRETEVSRFSEQSAYVLRTLEGRLISLEVGNPIAMGLMIMEITFATMTGMNIFMQTTPLL